MIQRLQDIILNNGGGLSPNGGAPRQLAPPPIAYGTLYPNSTGRVLPASATPWQ